MPTGRAAGCGRPAHAPPPENRSGELRMRKRNTNRIRPIQDHVRETDRQTRKSPPKGPSASTCGPFAANGKYAPRCRIIRRAFNRPHRSDHRGQHPYRSRNATRRIPDRERSPEYQPRASGREYPANCWSSDRIFLLLLSRDCSPAPQNPSAYPVPTDCRIREIPLIFTIKRGLCMF